MEPIIEMAEESRKLLDDCVAMLQCLEVLRERGAEDIDRLQGVVSLTEEAFDKAFPGLLWEEHLMRDGSPIGIWTKTAEYRGVTFETMRIDEE